MMSETEGKVPEKFEAWAVAEIMGHQRYAGFLTEQTIGGCAFVAKRSPATLPPSATIGR
jgi:hypothetical protein